MISFKSLERRNSLNRGNMGTTGNQVSETTNVNWEIDNLKVIQDFNNKKANSHATIFVASMFALFTVLSLATRIVKSTDGLVLNCPILGLSIATYILIWFFGLYSIGNFAYYSTVAQRAEEKIVRGMDKRLVEEYIHESARSRVFRKFANFKLNEGQGHTLTKIRSNNEYASIIIYIIIGFLPLLAFLIWAFSG